MNKPVCLGLSILKLSKILMYRGHFRSIWTVVYRFWAHLVWLPKLGMPGKKFSCESKQSFM